MKLTMTQKVLAVALPIFTCFSMQSWAVKKGIIARKPVYSAVIGLEGRSPGQGCSAVFIHPRAFLTAAHCRDFIDRGINHITYPNRNSDHRVSIQAVYVDPYYNPQTSWKGEFNANDDIALAVLREPIEDPAILSHIPKIVREDSLSPNDTLTVVGLGMYKIEPFALLGDQDNSERRMAPYRLVKKVGSVDFLKGVIPGIGSCGGDSGGALLRVSADETQAELVGLLTVTGGSCGSDQTDYAESVSSHLDWIKMNLQKEGINFE